ncbi:amidase [Martelella mangrovi]|uniref:Asp-tRNA(Asn)/Glu-tRNA(Gln) amidotransferase A subunit family amidase n=1 Tax=Martelella mangrovi TaxID=1397477 RepID=A0ABV2IDK9_9HYPH
MTTKTDAPLSALETRKAIASGRLTAVAAVEDLLARIAALEPAIGAWVAVDAEGARETARLLDQGPERGPLHGTGIGVKDIFAVKGLPWRCGSPIWAARDAAFDASSVAIARRAGGVILGKTVTTEFAGYKPSATLNPAAPGRTPGGSSSGSAAAVASGMVPLAFGSQTSGSIIRPASYCGVVGFKPGFDTIDTYGMAAFARSFDTVGVFARSVGDVAFAIEALSGLPMTAPDIGAQPAPLGLFRSAAWAHAEPAMIAAWEAFERDLQAAGVALCDAAPSAFAPELEDALSLHARIMAAEAADALAYETTAAPELLSEGLARQLAGGRSTPAEKRADDYRRLRHLRAGFIERLPADAVWLSPSSTGPAPRLEENTTGNPAFNQTWSLLGLPSCSIPLLSDAEGRPMGVQVTGTMGNDRGVLAVADWLMRLFAR